MTNLMRDFILVDQLSFVDGYLASHSRSAPFSIQPADVKNILNSFHLEKLVD